jgi:hypothetical protein
MKMQPHEPKHIDKSSKRNEAQDIEHGFLAIWLEDVDVFIVGCRYFGGLEGVKYLAPEKLLCGGIRE